MATDIKHLLAKKSWTGDDAGRAITMSLVHSYQDTLAGRPETTLFTVEHLKLMVGALKTREELTRYNRYVGLNNWISINHPNALNMYLRADNSLSRISAILTEITALEDGYDLLEQVPAIVTQKQYDEIKAARVEEQLADEHSLSVFELVSRALSYFLRQLAQSPHRANPLKAVRTLYSKQPLTSPLILGRYNEITSHGYFVLEDGTRTEEISREWLNAAQIQRLSQSIDAMEATRDVETFPAEWYPYEEPPEGLTKWDAIALDKLPDFYREALRDSQCKPKVYAHEAADFVAEFPELAQALLRAIDARCFDGAEGVAALPPEKWQASTFSPRMLYDLDFFGFKAEIESDENIFQGNRRAEAGVAILRPGRRALIDEKNGWYIEPQSLREGPFAAIGLGQFTPANPNYIRSRQEMRESFDSIVEAYYYVLGFDQAVEMIAKHIDIPDFTIFKLHTDSLSERIEMINRIVPLIYERVRQAEYANPQAEQDSLAALRECFPSINVQNIAIPQAAIDKAQEMLDDNLRAFAAQDGIFTNTLCVRGEEA